MQTSIVIPLGRGSTWGNNELKYCLRAVEKNVSNVGEIFIIGENPNWITNVTHIPAKDHPDFEYKERNIFKKILIATEIESVSDDFLFMNDDHIILSSFDADKFPYFIKENLMFYVERNNENIPYRTSLVNTITYLRLNGYTEDNFDVHCPIVYNKDKFKKLNSVNWDAEWGYVIKSLYGNINELKGVFTEDVKCGSIGQSKDFIRGRIFGKKFMSLTHFVNSDMRDLLEEMFPEKSKFEL